MAKIKLRLRKNGEPSYTVEVRVCGVQSSKTFHNKKDAQIWVVMPPPPLFGQNFNLFLHENGSAPSAVQPKV